MMTSGPASPSPILEVDRISRWFGGVRAVDEASFSLERGGITGLIGPNGAGKSTILSLIAGTQSPTNGRILYEGRDIAGSSPHEMARHGLIRTFQHSREFKKLTALENLMVAAPSRRGSTLWGSLRSKKHWLDDERSAYTLASALLERFGLQGVRDEYAGELSTGQRRLIDLTRALMAEPKVLLLDEPFAGILPSLARVIENELKTLRDEGLTLLVVEHNLETIERLTDSVIVMAQGSVLAEGSMAELREEREVLDVYLAG